MRLFDSHAHYFDDRFDGIADGILKNEVFCGKVERVVNVGTNNENNIVCLEQSRNYDGMYAACGIHPEDARYLEGTPDEELSRLEKIISEEMSCSNCCASESIERLSWVHWLRTFLPSECLPFATRTNSNQLVKYLERLKLLPLENLITHRRLRDDLSRILCLYSCTSYEFSR